MGLITVDEAKTFLQITKDTKDLLIEALIPEIENFIRTECNQDFKDPWPAGLKLTASKMIGYTMAEMSGGGQSIGLQSETQENYSYTRGTPSQKSGAYPDAIMDALKLHKVGRVHFAQRQTIPNDRRGTTLNQLSKDVFLDTVEGVINADL